jgi:hypothetical protein
MRNMGFVTKSVPIGQSEIVGSEKPLRAIKTDQLTINDLPSKRAKRSEIAKFCLTYDLLSEDDGTSTGPTRFVDGEVDVKKYENFYILSSESSITQIGILNQPIWREFMRHWIALESYSHLEFPIALVSDLAQRNASIRPL